MTILILNLAGKLRSNRTRIPSPINVANEQWVIVGVILIVIVEI